MNLKKQKDDSILARMLPAKALNLLIKTRDKQEFNNYLQT